MKRRPRKLAQPVQPPTPPYPVFCPSRGCLRGIRVQADPAKLWKDPHTDTRTVAVASPRSAALPQPMPGAPISCGLTVTSLRRLGSRWSRACALYGDSHDRAVSSVLGSPSSPPRHTLASSFPPLDAWHQSTGHFQLSSAPCRRGLPPEDGWISATYQVSECLGPRQTRGRFGSTSLFYGTRALEAKWSRVRLTEATGGQRLKERKVPRRTRCGLCG